MKGSTIAALVLLIIGIIILLIGVILLYSENTEKAKAKKESILPGALTTAIGAMLIIVSIIIFFVAGKSSKPAAKEQ